jgi:hypothetical protein
MNIDNGSTSFRNQSLSLLKKVFSYFYFQKKKIQILIDYLAFYSYKR